MGAVFFYHLTRSPLEVTLPMLLVKSRQAGWRACVRATSCDRLKWLDEKLWLVSTDAFIPHGVAGGEFDQDQPILLTTSDKILNDAACLMAVDGASVSPDEVQALKRICVIFDGNDPAALGVARAQWKTLTNAGCAAQYWSQADGNWSKKSEVGAKDGSG